MKKIAEPSVQSLLIQMRYNGQALSTGTGFIVFSSKGPCLITNRHNVTGRRQDNNKPIPPTCAVPNEIVIFHHHRSGIGTWVSVVERLYNDDDFLQKRWVEHPELITKADLVALPLQRHEEIIFYPFKLEDAGPKLRITPGDVVSVVGFPFGMTAGLLFPVWATGFVASEPEVDFDNLPILLIDCRSRQGQSGSPVLAYRSGGAVTLQDGTTSIFDGPISNLIGIYSGRINAESDLGIVWKTSTIIDLLSGV